MSIGLKDRVGQCSADCRRVTQAPGALLDTAGRGGPGTRSSGGQGHGEEKGGPFASGHMGQVIGCDPTSSQMLHELNRLLWGLQGSHASPGSGLGSPPKWIRSCPTGGLGSLRSLGLWPFDGPVFGCHKWQSAASHLTSLS